MTKSVIVHIGTHKTGSTSIQGALAKAHNSGSIRPACYPVAMGRLNHKLLASKYLPSELIPAHWPAWLSAGDTRTKNLLTRYERLVFEALRSAECAVLSAENMSYYPTEGVQQLRRDLETAGYRNFHIVLYIRDPAEFYLSQTQQFLKSLAEVPNPKLFRYRFAETAATWESVFPGRVIVRHYRCSAEHDVVQDFSGLLRAHLGVSLPATSPRLNTTISAEGMEILDRYRPIYWQGKCAADGPNTGRLVGYLQSAQVVRQTRPTLRPVIADMIRANHKVDAELINSRYGIDLGLQDANFDGTTDDPDTYRVADILQYVDPDVVTHLLVWLVKAGLGGGNERTKGDPIARIAALIRRLATRSSLPTPPASWWEANSPAWNDLTADLQAAKASSPARLGTSETLGS